MYKINVIKSFHHAGPATPAAMLPTSHAPVTSTTTALATSSTIIAGVVPSVVALILLVTLAGLFVTICLLRYRKRDSKVQTDAYYSVAGLPALPARPNTMSFKKKTELLYWTIADVKGGRSEPLGLTSDEDKDVKSEDHQQAAPFHEASCNIVSEQQFDRCSATATSDGPSCIGTTNIADVEMEENTHIAYIDGTCHQYDDSYNDENIPAKDNSAYCTNIAIAPNVETEENIAYSNGLLSSSTVTVKDNPAYGTNIAIAPDVETEENVAYIRSQNM